MMHFKRNFSEHSRRSFLAGTQLKRLVNHSHLMDDARWEFLRPWCAPLRRRTAFAYEWTGGAPATACTGLSVALSPVMDAAALRGVRDALLLLAVLARVDFSAWKRVLLAHCGIRTGPTPDSAEAPSLRESRVELELSAFTDMGPDALEDVSDLAAVTFCRLLMPPPTLPSNAHLLRLAVRQIMARGDPEQTRLAGWSLDIPIAVVVRCDFDPHAEGLWHAIKGLRAANGGYHIPVPVLKETVGIDCAFTLGPLKLEVAGGQMDGEMTALVEDMVANGDGIVFSRMDLPLQLDSSSIRNHTTEIQVVGSMVQQVLCASGGRRAVLEAVGLVMDSNCGPHIARICSAIVETQSTQVLELTYGAEDLSVTMRAWVWQWVAYALFSPAARGRSSVTSVKMADVCMTEGDAEAIADLITSSDPVGLLLLRRDDAEQRSVASCAMLKQDTFVTPERMDEREILTRKSARWKLSTDVYNVMVLGHDGAKSRVVIPGYGLCKVRQADVVPADKDKRPETDITSLHLSFSSRGNADSGLQRFLQLVGPPLTRLQLKLSSKYSPLLPTIFNCCPKLKILVLDGSAITASELIQAVRASHVDLEQLVCTISDLEPLASELSDSSSRLAKSLVCMDVRLESPRRQGVATLDVQLVRIAQMLSTNRTLQYVHLTLPGAPLDAMLTTRCLQRVRRFHGEALPIAREPFPLDCRLAFLSVFGASSRSTPSDSSGRQQLMPPTPLLTPQLAAALAQFPAIRGVFLRIFDLAASCVLRRVFVDNRGR